MFENDWASLVAQIVKDLPVMQETQVWSLAWEDPLEKGMATHSSILAWKIPWTDHGVAKSQHNWAANTENDWHHMHGSWLPCGEREKEMGLVRDLRELQNQL